MSDDTVTGWRTKALKAWALCVEYRDYSVPAGTFLLGLVIGKVW